MTHERLSRCAKARVLRKWCGEAQREFFGLSFQVRAHTKDPKGHCGRFGSFSCIQHEHESWLAAILTICQFTNRLPHAFPFAIPGRNYGFRNPRLRRVVAVIIVPFIWRSLASPVRHTYQKGPTHARTGAAAL